MAKLAPATSVSLIALLLSIPPLAHVQDLVGARHFVAQLYDRYGTGDPVYLRGDGPSAFAPQLLQQIRRLQAQEPGALDWDPICGCQDPTGLKMIHLDMALTGPSKASAAVQLQRVTGSHPT
jgi:hypothetical protein